MSTTRQTRSKAAPKSQEVPQGTRGARSDIAKYELFAFWAEQEYGYKIAPADAQFAIRTYHRFQRSDVNRAFNAEKRAARAKAATPTPTAAKKAPSIRQMQKDLALRTPRKPAKSAPRPAAKKAATTAKAAPSRAKATTARRTRKAA